MTYSMVLCIQVVQHRCWPSNIDVDSATFTVIQNQTEIETVKGREKNEIQSAFVHDPSCSVKGKGKRLANCAAWLFLGSTQLGTSRDGTILYSHDQQK